jgi:hypothetical protein
VYQCGGIKKKDGDIGNGKKANGKMERPPMGPPLGNRNRETNGQFIKATGRDLKRMGRMEMDDMYECEWQQHSTASAQH